MHPLISDLMQIFEGYSKAYGYYSGDLYSEGGKMVGKRGSVSAPVTVELWEKHVTGKQGLGIIPINENSQVRWAAIDIDQYDIDIFTLNKRIQENKLPLVLCRTKSGGVHLYVFLSEFHDAGEVQRRMREFAALLGYGGSEVFPKQTKILADRGDVGNWINMPYFKAGKTERYALSPNNIQMSLEEFIRYAREKTIKPVEFLSLKIERVEHLKGGPPCLQHLISMGFPKGTRNNGLFNLAVYAKKANPDTWESLLSEYNQLYMDPPLEAVEVVGVIKSVARKEFFYACNTAPIAQYCEKAKCRTCQFGIGTGDLGMPKFGSLTKLKTNPPIWFLEIEGGGRMELTTEQLQSQRLFQARCMSVINVMPIPPKNEVWQEIVSALLADCNEVEVPFEATPLGQLKQHLEDFCTSRVAAKVPEDLLMGKPWLNNKFYYFRMQDFMEFLDRRRWRLMPSQFIAMHLREWNAGHRFFNFKGKGCNTYFVREDLFTKQEEPFDVPEQGKETPY